MSEAGISAVVEDVLMWPYFHSKLEGSSFKRCSCISYFSVLQWIEFLISSCNYATLFASIV
jgi:hypothetical protein